MVPARQGSVKGSRLFGTLLALPISMAGLYLGGLVLHASNPTRVSLDHLRAAVPTLTAKMAPAYT